PPVHAWAALRVFEIDASSDFDFLERVFQKLLLNFTWSVNRKDSEGNNIFEGGFLGLDNIGPIDRSAPLPEGGHLEQSDGTAWMAMYCLNLLEMSLLLADHDPAYEDMATKFFEHFAYIASAMNEQGLWDQEDGFYYDVLHLGDRQMPLRVRSMVGLIPVFAVTTLGRGTLDRLQNFAGHVNWFLSNKPQYEDVIGHVHALGEHEGRLLSIVNPDRLRRILSTALDESGRRPVFGGVQRFQNDPAWHDSLLFYEYFNGDDGAGLGASHQTGWTGLVADMIVRVSAALAEAETAGHPAITADQLVRRGL